jgi:hypothetical protein
VPVLAAVGDERLTLHRIAGVLLLRGCVSTDSMDQIFGILLGVQMLGEALTVREILGALVIGDSFSSSTVRSSRGYARRPAPEAVTFR